jgi:hypothetical protein
MFSLSAAHIMARTLHNEHTKYKICRTCALRLEETKDPMATHRRQNILCGRPLLRQVFISLSCLYWNWPKNMQFPGLSGDMGERITYEPWTPFQVSEARVVLKGGT